MQPRRSCDVHSFLNITGWNVIFVLLKKTNVKPVVCSQQFIYSVHILTYTHTIYTVYVYILCVPVHACRDRHPIHTLPASMKAVTTEWTRTWLRHVSRLPPESRACVRSDTDHRNELPWSVSAHIVLKWNVLPRVMLISRAHHQCMRTMRSSWCFSCDVPIWEITYHF